MPTWLNILVLDSYNVTKVKLNFLQQYIVNSVQLSTPLSTSEMMAINPTSLPGKRWEVPTTPSGTFLVCLAHNGCKARVQGQSSFPGSPRVKGGLWCILFILAAGEDTFQGL